MISTKDIPIGIIFNKQVNKYIVNISYNNIKYISKNYDDLKDAVLELEKYRQEVQLVKDIEEKLHIEKNITRNSDNIAIIIIKNKDNKMKCDVLVDDENWHDLTRYA